MISTERSIAMSNHPHLVLTPSASRKRKEREGVDTLKPSTTTNPTAPVPTVESEPTPAQAQASSSSSNRILAGYLAHEFLTHGTLFGQKWDPAPASSSSAAPADDGGGVREDEKGEIKKEVANGKAVEDGEITVPVNESAAHQRYVAVAKLMKLDGTHLPGIVNPTQLSRWLQI